MMPEIPTHPIILWFYDCYQQDIFPKWDIIRGPGDLKEQTKNTISTGRFEGNQGNCKWFFDSYSLISSRSILCFL